MLRHKFQNSRNSRQARTRFARKRFGNRLIGAIQTVGAIDSQIARDAIENRFFVRGSLHENNPLDHRFGEISMTCGLARMYFRDVTKPED